MSINKEKNVMIQITFPKEEADDLERLQKSLAEHGTKVSKSTILLVAFRNFMRMLLMVEKDSIKNKEKKED